MRDLVAAWQQPCRAVLQLNRRHFSADGARFVHPADFRRIRFDIGRDVRGPRDGSQILDLRLVFGM